MSERIVRQANLDRIENRLRALDTIIETKLGSMEHDMRSVSGQVNDVSQRVVNAQSQLDDLVGEFREFVRQDQLAKQLQLAVTRLVKVRQEIETEFGHYSEVRRRATGILQAVDANLVKKSTIESASEEYMIATPRYWLAPCLIALAAWLNDNKELANKAMMEALRRDDEKTSLFFALVSRRGGRYKASSEWLNRYLGMQVPQELNRETVIIIDAFSNGVFGPDARMKCARNIQDWIEELSQKAGFVEEQCQQWKDGLKSKEKPLDSQIYPHLRKYSPTWNELESALRGSKLHEIIHDYFSELFNKEIVPAKSIAFAVDAMLDTLITNFDEEELPKRRTERLLTLIVEAEGDRDLAQSRFDAEKNLEEKVSFTQLLTNFAMHPEVSNASLATQKLSIALSKEWIEHAHDDLTAENRVKVPTDITIEIEGWTGITRDGMNEESLVQDLKKYVSRRKEVALARLRLGFKRWAALAAAIIFIPLAFSTPFLFVLSAALIAYFFVSRNQISRAKAKMVHEYDEILNSFTDVLRAILADVVDYRKEYAEEDAKAVKIGEFLATISPEQYSFSSYDPARTIISNK